MNDRSRHLAALCHAVGLAAVRADPESATDGAGLQATVIDRSRAFLTNQLDDATAGTIVTESIELTAGDSKVGVGSSESVPGTDDSQPESGSDGADEDRQRAAASLALARHLSGATDATTGTVNSVGHHDPGRLRSIFEASEGVTTGNTPDGDDGGGPDTPAVYPLAPLELSREAVFPQTQPQQEQDQFHGTPDAHESGASGEVQSSAGVQSGDGDDADTHQLTERYASLWDGLCETVSPAAGLETVTSALEKYTWCLPASPLVADDRVSLFDYLRTTAALTEAVYHSEHSTAALVETVRRFNDTGAPAPVSIQSPTGDATDTPETGSDTAGELATDDGDSHPDSDSGDSAGDPLYTLVKGDISGIQQFIHRLRSPDDAQTNIAKRTRGRSLQVWLLNEGLSRLLCSALDLPTVNILWAGGGQFYALVPPTSDDELDSFEEEVNEWLIEQFDADLLFVLGKTDVTDPTSDFGDLFKQVAHATDQNKFQKGDQTFAALDGAVLDREQTPAGPCDTCGGDIEGDQQSLRESPTDPVRCENCRTQEDIGYMLPRASYVRLDHEPRTDPDVHLSIDVGDGLSWELVEHSNCPDAAAVFSLNSTAMPSVETAETPDAGFLFTGATAPTGGAVDRVWSFAELQQLGQGSADAIHASKLDIDDLGEAIGTRMDGGPAQLAAFSRALEVFFSGYVNVIAGDAAYYYDDGACPDCAETLAEGELYEVDHDRFGGAADESAQQGKYYDLSPKAADTLHTECVERVPPIYISFSGGDDMLFVGPWDDAVRFGQAVRDAFQEYAGESPSLSGGYFLTRPKYPVGRAAERAEEHISIAKNYRHGDPETEAKTSESGHSGGAMRKNAVHLFGTTRPWHQSASAGPQPQSDAGLARLIETSEWLADMIENDELSRSFLSTLRQLDDDSVESVAASGPQSGQVLADKDRDWRLKYELARRFDGEELRDVETRLSTVRSSLDIPVTWASLVTR